MAVKWLKLDEGEFLSVYEKKLTPKNNTGTNIRRSRRFIEKLKEALDTERSGGKQWQIDDDLYSNSNSIFKITRADGQEFVIYINIENNYILPNTWKKVCDYHDIDIAKEHRLFVWATHFPYKLNQHCLYYIDQKGLDTMIKNCYEHGEEKTSEKGEQIKTLKDKSYGISATLFENMRTEKEEYKEIIKSESCVEQRSELYDAYVLTFLELIKGF